MACITEKQKRTIISLYKSGLTLKRVVQQTGHAESTIHKTLVEAGVNRSQSEARKLGFQNGSICISDKTRRKLSDQAKRSIRTRQKIWTKPERRFKSLLNDLGLGVVFPKYVSDIFGVLSDSFNRQIYFQYPIQRYVCDFVDVDKMVVFRVNGDFWHANPILYQDLTPIQKHNKRQDSNAKNYLERKGWKVVDIWESEIYWNPEIVKDRIRAAREKANPPLLRRGDTGIDTQAAHSDWSEKLRSLWFSKRAKKVEKVKKKCLRCGLEFVVSRTNKKQMKRKYCSSSCSKVASRTARRPTKQQLAKQMENNSWLALGRKYNVSDNSVRKWAMGYGLL